MVSLSTTSSHNDDTRLAFQRVDDGIQVVSQLSQEERTAVKTAFLSGDDFAWMVGGKHFKTNLDEKQHVEATFYMLECVLTFAERFGHILVSRDAMESFKEPLH